MKRHLSTPLSCQTAGSIVTKIRQLPKIPKLCSCLKQWWAKHFLVTKDQELELVIGNKRSTTSVTISLGLGLNEEQWKSARNYMGLINDLMLPRNAVTQGTIGNTLCVQQVLVLLLNKTQVKARLKFANDNLGYLDRNWENVMWSDMRKIDFF